MNENSNVSNVTSSDAYVKFLTQHMVEYSKMYPEQARLLVLQWISGLRTSEIIALSMEKENANRSSNEITEMHKRFNLSIQDDSIIQSLIESLHAEEVRRITACRCHPADTMKYYIHPNDRLTREQ